MCIIILSSSASLISCSKDSSEPGITSKVTSAVIGEDITGAKTTDNAVSDSETASTSEVTTEVELLENLESSGETSTAEFTMDMDPILGSMRIKITYYTDTDIVCDVHITSNINPSHPSYTDTVKMYESLVSEINAKGDSAITITSGVDEQGVASFIYEITGLAREDRAPRVMFVREYLGPMPDDTDCVFYFTSMKTKLIEMGYPAV